MTVEIYFEFCRVFQSHTNVWSEAYNGFNFNL